MGYKGIPPFTEKVKAHYAIQSQTALAPLTWEVNHNANQHMTSLQGSFTTSYKKLKALLGEPVDEADGYKVSTQWTLVSPKGEVATIYDWKETNLYDPDYQSVEELRSHPSVEWHIGAHTKSVANELIEALKKSIK